jgi:hypothetical protein
MHEDSSSSLLEQQYRAVLTSPEGLKVWPMSKFAPVAHQMPWKLKQSSGRQQQQQQQESASFSSY